MMKGNRPDEIVLANCEVDVHDVLPTAYLFCEVLENHLVEIFGTGFGLAI